MTYLVALCPACRRTIGAIPDGKRGAMNWGRGWLKHGLDVDRIEASERLPVLVSEHADDCPTGARKVRDRLTSPT